MKIIVNEVPKRSIDCPFSKYLYSGYSCKLKKDTCDVDYNRECEMLMSAKELKAGGIDGSERTDA